MPLSLIFLYKNVWFDLKKIIELVFRKNMPLGSGNAFVLWVSSMGAITFIVAGCFVTIDAVPGGKIAVFAETAFQ